MDKTYGEVVFNKEGRAKYGIVKITLTERTKIVSDLKHIYIHKSRNTTPTLSFNIEYVGYAWYTAYYKGEITKVIVDDFELEEDNET